MKCPYCIKICSKCGEILVANNMNYGKLKTGKYGLRGECKKCANQRSKEYRKNNTERIKEQRKEYYQTHKDQENQQRKEYYQTHKDQEKEYNKEYRKNNAEQIKQYQKEYRKNNAEQIKEYQKEYKKEYYKNNVKQIKEQHKEYYKNNAEQIKEQRKEYYKNNAEQVKEYQKEYRQNNADKIKERDKEYRKNNPDKVFNNHNKRRQRENSQGMGINKEQWLDMMQYFDWKCAYSGKPLKDNNRTIDHVKPLVKRGLNEIFNCVPCDKSINSSKHDKDFMEWYKGQEFYDESRLQKIYEWQQHCLETYYEYIKIS